MEDPRVLKVFHFARFDVAALAHWLGIATAPIYCTRTASKLARTYTDRHGLKDNLLEFLDVELDKVHAPLRLVEPRAQRRAGPLRDLGRDAAAAADGPPGGDAEARGPRRARPRVLLGDPHAMAQLDLPGFVDLFEH